MANDLNSDWEDVTPPQVANASTPSPLGSDWEDVTPESDVAIGIRSIAKSQLEESFPTRLARSAIQTLPTAGALTGATVAGLAATPETLGLGTVPAAMTGAALGGAAGEQAKQILMNKFFPGENTPSPISKEGLVDTAVTGLEQGIGEGAGQIIGVGLSKIPKLIGETKLAKGAIKKLEEVAGEKAFKSLGPNQKDVKIAVGKAVGDSAKKKIQDIGNTVLEYGVVGKLPTSYTSLAERAINQAEKVGEQLGSTIDDLANLSDEIRKVDPNLVVGVDKAPMIKRISDNLIDQTGVPGVGGENKRIQALIDEFASGPGVIDIKSAQALKESVGKKINWKRDPRADVPIKEQFYRELYSSLRDGIEDGAEALAGNFGKEYRENFVKLKKNYGDLKKAAQIANEKSGREFANRYISLSDYQSGQFGGVLGLATSLAKGGGVIENIIGGVGGAALGSLGNKGARRYVNQVNAKAAKGAAGLLKELPEKELIKQSTIRSIRAVKSVSDDEKDRRKKALENKGE